MGLEYDWYVVIFIPSPLREIGRGGGGDQSMGGGGGGGWKWRVGCRSLH